MLIHTLDLDPAATIAMMERLRWTPADLAREAKLREEHVRDLLAGRVCNSGSARAIQAAINQALRSRGV